VSRPNKNGLDYLPIDIDFEDDDKIALIEAGHGLEGFAILIKVLIKIYREGYYYEWHEQEQLLFAKRKNIDYKKLKDVVDDALKWEFLSKKMCDKYHILTSRGIQKRYLFATKRRKERSMIKEYLLADLTEYPDVKLVSVGKNKPKKKEKKAEIIFTEDNFALFYEIYPKRVEKKDALKEWLLLNNKKSVPPPDELYKIVDKQVESGSLDTREKCKYCMSPRRWLHGDRWEDEIQKNKTYESEEPKSIDINDPDYFECGECGLKAIFGKAYTECDCGAKINRN